MNISGTDTLEINQTRTLIEQNLLSDWAIKVEYAYGDDLSSWQQWDQTFEAITSSGSVIDAISACHKKYPNRPIRLNVEQIITPVKTQYAVHQPDVEEITAANTADSETSPLQSLVRNSRRKAWQVAAAASAILGSVAVVELATN